MEATISEGPMLFPDIQRDDDRHDDQLHSNCRVYFLHIFIEFMLK